MPDVDLRRRPDYRHVFVLQDGETITVARRQAVRVVDRRSDRSFPETLWEVTLDSGLVRRVWASELADWRMEEV